LPIAKHCTIAREDLSPTMLAYCQKFDLLKRPTSTVTSSYWAHDIVLSTNYVCWLLEHGYYVYNYQLVMQFAVTDAFSGHIDRLYQLRREAEDNGDSISSKLYKFLSNSCYGITLIDAMRFIRKIVSESKSRTCLLRQDPAMLDFIECPDDFGELSFRPSKVVNRQLVQIGLNVLLESKLINLSFAIDFVQKFVPAERYQWAYQDTDSYMLVLSEPTLRDAVPPERLAAFDEASKRFLVPDPLVDMDNYRRLRNFPGLWKQEMAGIDLFIALRAKLYVCLKNGQSLPMKSALHGLSHKPQANIGIVTREMFLSVLLDKNDDLVSGKMRGLIGKHGLMMSYEVVKHCLSSAFYKRAVMPCYCCTRPYLHK
jgi:hypothetical protein